MVKIMKYIIVFYELLCALYSKQITGLHLYKNNYDRLSVWTKYEFIHQP